MTGQPERRFDPGRRPRRARQRGSIRGERKNASRHREEKRRDEQRPIERHRSSHFTLEKRQVSANANVVTVNAQNPVKKAPTQRRATPKFARKLATR